MNKIPKIFIILFDIYVSSKNSFLILFYIMDFEALVAWSNTIVYTLQHLLYMLIELN